MKIKTYTARDMKTALRLVRDEQGPDAVILSTRHFAGGVEVSVAMDAEEARCSGRPRPPPAPRRLRRSAMAPLTSPAPAPLPAPRLRWTRSSARNCARCASCWNRSCRSWRGTI